MTHGMTGRAVSAGLMALLSLRACRSGGVTARKLENALAPTFANLIHVQRNVLALPIIEASALRATATCKRIGPGPDATGGGDWKCTVDWSPPGYRGILHDTYDLSVTMDGCYTATSDASEGHLGGPTLLRPGSAVPVTNMLYAFDGCFDPD